MQSIINKIVHDLGASGIEAMNRQRAINFINDYAGEEKKMLDAVHNAAIKRVLSITTDVAHKEAIQKLLRPE
jgi:hypothetical protein